MPYANETPFAKIPYPAAGEDTSAAEEAFRSGIPDWYLEVLVRGFAGADGDGTLTGAFQVSDGGGLDVEVSPGLGFIGGLVIAAAEPTAAEGLPDDSTNYLFLKRTATTHRDRTFTVEISTDPPPMADAIYIAQVVTESGDIVSIDNSPPDRTPAVGPPDTEAVEAILEWYLYTLVRLFAGADGDGTLEASFAVSDEGGLDIAVAAGMGFIGGTAIEATEPTPVEGIPDDETVHIYLQRTLTSEDDRTFTVEVSTDPPPMADAIYIAQVVTESGAIIDISNNPAGRAPYIRGNPNPQIISDIPSLLVVAPSGGMYDDPRAAIHACNAGDTVLICPGTYDIAASINVPANNISIVGLSRDACILNFTAADSAHCLNLGGRSGCRIENLALVAAAGKTGSAVYGAICTDIVLRRLKVTGLAATAIPIQAATSGARWTIESCRIDVGARFGISLADCPDSLIADNIVSLSGVVTSSSLCIMIVRSDRCRVVANLIHATGEGAGRVLYNRSGNHIIVAHNIAIVDSPHSTARQIEAFAFDNSIIGMMILGNIVVLAGGAGYGISLWQDGDYTISGTIISSNTVRDGARGVSLPHANITNTLVHGNVLRTCTTGISDAGAGTVAADNVLPPA